MKRTKNTAPDAESQQLFNRLQVLVDMTTRLGLAGAIGETHDGKRDLWQSLGYPDYVKSWDLLQQWKRGDIARAVVDRPVKATWQGTVELNEPEDKEETNLEIAYKALDKKLKLKSKLMRADRLSQLGRYSLILLGFDDTTKDTWAQPVNTSGNRELKYLRVVSDHSSQIESYDLDPQSPRYGKPRLYHVKLEAPGNAERIVSLTVHYTRIIHITDDLLEDDIEGVPVLETIYNRLLDISKLAGGSAEMFWRGARPGYAGVAQEGYKIGADAKKDLKKQIEEYEHDLRRILVSEGVDLHSLAQQVADPKNHMQVQFQIISSITNIPLRILFGSERGELASTQDSNSWKEYIAIRRDEHAEASIIRPFVDRLIEYGALPEPQNELDSYEVAWSDLFAMSAKDKSAIGKTLSEAILKYVETTEAESTIPLEAFLLYVLKMDEDQVTQIIEKRDEYLEEFDKEEAAIFDQPALESGAGAGADTPPFPGSEEEEEPEEEEE